MADLTEAVIRNIDDRPEIRTMAMAQIVALMEREMQLREALEVALQRAGVELPGGWIDWEEVIAHYRRQAEEGIIRDELRRNRMAEREPLPIELELSDED